MGGFAIFATKLDYSGEDQYKEIIHSLAEEEYWSFTSEHVFFRYDKLCDKVGKFSTKKVKIFAYQKTDRTAYILKQEEIQRKI